MLARNLAHPGVFDAALSAPCGWIFKHSPICPTSERAEREVERYAAAHPELPVYRVDVIGDRPVSQSIAARLGIRHESPQAILLVAGRPVWDDSHGGVTAAALERASLAHGVMPGAAVVEA